MLELFLPQSATRVIVCLKPISVRWGATKLGAFCRDVLGVEPDLRTCFLFVNARHDTLLLYFVDHEGDQTLTKKLEKGSFLLPAPDASDRPYVVLRPSVLGRLFRSGAPARKRVPRPHR